MRKAKLWIGVVLAIALVVGGGAVFAHQETGPGGYLDAATLTRLAQALGLTPAELASQLQAGQTLAQIAEGRGVAADRVVEAIVAPYQDQLELQVKYGYISQAQADQLLAEAVDQANLLIDQPLSGVQGEQDTWDDMIAECDAMMAEHHGGEEMGGMMGGWDSGLWRGMGGMMGGWGSGIMGGRGWGLDGLFRGFRNGSPPVNALAPVNGFGSMVNSVYGPGLAPVNSLNGPGFSRGWGLGNMMGDSGWGSRMMGRGMMGGGMGSGMMGGGMGGMMGGWGR